MMRSLAKSLVAGVAVMACAEPTAAIESLITGVGGGQAFEQAMLSSRADEIEEEWTQAVGAATARRWRDYHDQLPPGIAGAFVAWWQAGGRAQLQPGAWQNRSAGNGDARSSAERLTVLETWIDANYPGGLRAFDAELVRCYGDAGVHLLVLCSPSILDIDPVLARLSAERQDLLQLVGKTRPAQ